MEDLVQGFDHHGQCAKHKGCNKSDDAKCQQAGTCSDELFPEPDQKGVWYIRGECHTTGLLWAVSWGRCLLEWHLALSFVKGESLPGLSWNATRAGALKVTRYNLRPNVS